MNPHLVLAVFYLSLTLVATVGAALIGVDLMPAVSQLRWLRVHFVTLGVLTQLFFAALPALVAERTGQPQPKVRWDTWAVYNAGLVALLVGIPLANHAMIVAGGTLVLAAVLLLIWQVRTLARAGSRACSAGARFLGVGLLYLLLGGFLGTGLWLGWSTWLHLPAPKEVHVHSNNWGYAALVMGGLLVSLLPSLVRRVPARSKSVIASFLLMAVGALGMVLGPWLDIRVFDTAGVMLHAVGTVLLLVYVARSLRAGGRLWNAGSLQLLSPYFWFLVVVAMAPIVVLFPGSMANSIAGQGGLILIYGWLLPFTFALLPYLLKRSFLPGQTAELGGTWLSVGAGHAGTALYLAGLLLAGFRGPLQTAAFVLWAISAVPILIQSWRRLSAGTRRLEEVSRAQVGDKSLASMS